MKDLRELINYYNKRVEMYQTMSFKAEKDVDKAYYNGIAEGFEKAAKELEKVNEEINNKIQKLL